MRQRLAFLLSSLILALVLCAPGAWADISADNAPQSNPAPDEVELQILSTSDTHGSFYPWDYATDKAFTKGSLAQVATAIKKIKRPNSLVLEAGDSIQGNDAQIFHKDPIHPMMLAMNYIGYDAMTTGNHEYNFGMENLKYFFSTAKAPLLLCNVYAPTGERLAQPYKIFNKNGLRVAVIGMVTPNITRWDAVNLKGWKVTDPVVETKAILKELEGKADVFIALSHMGLESEYDVPNSGAMDLAQNCPELSYIVTSHAHTAVPRIIINSVIASQNINRAETVSEMRLYFSRQADGSWKMTRHEAKLHQMKDYDPDPELMKQLEPFHERALADCRTQVGVLEGGSLLPPAEIIGVNPALIRPTALIGFINEVSLYYSGAKVACNSLLSPEAGLDEGNIAKSGVTRLYKYDNTLYKVQMNGKQLRQFMESVAKFYNTLGKNDLTISFNPNIRIYNNYIFSGIDYQIDISRPVGERIVKLTWPDGTPVKDDEVFTLACSDYCAKTNLLAYGPVFSTGEELPVLLEAEVHSEIGIIRELIIDYIANVKKGHITPETPSNWCLTGITWDPQLHKEAVELLNQGKLQLKTGKDNRSSTPVSVTIEDLQEAKAQADK